VAVVQKFIDAHPTPAVMPHWQALQTALGKLQMAFGLTR
jgi:hypothetical protein